MSTTPMPTPTLTPEPSAAPAAAPVAAPVPAPVLAPESTAPAVPPAAAPAAQPTLAELRQAAVDASRGTSSQMFGTPASGPTPAAASPAAAAAATPAAPATPAVKSEEEQLQDFLLDQQDAAAARRLGFPSVNAYREHQQAQLQISQQIQLEALATRFYSAAPDFPDTPESCNALEETRVKYNLPGDLNGLIAAHALAIRDGRYVPATTTAPGQPLSPRPVPPPTLSSSSSPSFGPSAADPFGGRNPYDRKQMSLAELREMALKSR